MHRFFIPPTQIENKQVVLEAAQAHQIASVLRMTAGDQIVVLDNSGREYEVELTAVTRKQVTGEIIAHQLAETEPQIHLTLYQSLLKRDNFEWVLQKGTELGVSRFVPIITRRTVAHPPKNQKRWQRILTEAAEQSRRGRLPELCAPVALATALAEIQPGTIAFVAWEEENGRSLRLPLAQSRDCALFIGPEGGFAAEEIEQARAHQVQPVSLGKRILRAETAALVGTTLILHLMEEQAYNNL